MSSKVPPRLPARAGRVQPAPSDDATEKRTADDNAGTTSSSTAFVPKASAELRARASQRAANPVQTPVLDGFKRDMPYDFATDLLTSAATWGKAFEAGFSNQTTLTNAKVAGAGVTVLSQSGPQSAALDAYQSAFGGNGPLAPHGPTGEPAKLISGSDAWARERDDVRGPLSQYGIFSSRGPAFVNPTNGAIGSGLRVGESNAVGGFAGPSSSWGALGPLSEIGAHGFKRDPTTGDFLDESGTVQRTVDAQYDSSTATRLHLFERYSEARAKQLGNLGEQDTSFGVDGTLGSPKEMDVYKFTVDRPQVVTINALPTEDSVGDKKNVDLVVFDKQGKPVRRTTSTNEASWVQVVLAPGEYAVGVVRSGTASVSGRPAKPQVASSSGPASYRLDVTGTQTQNFVFDLKKGGQALIKRDAPVSASTIDRIDLSRLSADDVRMTPAN